MKQVTKIKQKKSTGCIECGRHLYSKNTWYGTTRQGICKKCSLRVICTGIARLRGRDRPDFEDYKTMNRWIIEKVQKVDLQHFKFGICTICKNRVKYFYEYDKKKKICEQCLFMLGDAKGERTKTKGRCFICDIDLELKQVLIHLQTKHPDKYEMMMIMCRNKGDDKKEAYGVMLVMAVMRRDRDEKDEERTMKRLHILEGQLEEMGIYLPDPEEVGERMEQLYRALTIDLTKCVRCGKTNEPSESFFCDDCMKTDDVKESYAEVDDELKKGVEYGYFHMTEDGRFYGSDKLQRDMDAGFLYDKELTEEEKRGIQKEKRKSRKENLREWR